MTHQAANAGKAAEPLTWQQHTGGDTATPLGYAMQAWTGAATMARIDKAADDAAIDKELLRLELEGRNEMYANPLAFHMVWSR